MKHSSKGVLFFRIVIALTFLVGLSGGIGGCSGGSGGSYAVGGTLSGLGAGEEVVLQNNGADDIEVTVDGAFTFATAVADSSAYAVTVLSKPAGKFFTVTNGSGTISGADVTDVTVACAAVAPGIDAVKVALGANNADGMVPGLALGGITLPVCTKTDGSALDFPVTYSMTDLPAWLAFDASTRDLTLNGVATVPTDAYTASTVTYKCTDSADTTQFAAISFTINDLDQGGVVDGFEYENGYVPLVNGQGYILLNPSNIVLYRGGTSDFNVPTSIIIAAVGMNPTDAVDDTADFDGDTLTNLVEIQNETNIFVALSAGAFGAAVLYAVGDKPDGLTTGDFDGDGDLDLATPNVFDNNISVLLGNGDGTFAAAVSYAVGNAPLGITIGDFNDDSDLDLAVVNIFDKNTSILLGDGDGTFAAAVNYDVGNESEYITTGDFNGDGYLDLAVTKRDSDNISILLGNGDGTFAIAVNYGVGDYPKGITAGNFDGDGDMDLAVTNRDDNNISVLLGNGDGTFAAAVNYAAGDEPYGITTGDFDGDSDLDLAVTNIISNNVSVLLGVGDGTFAAAVNYAAGNAPQGITTGDFDGDGDPDLAVANIGDDNTSILFGEGDGTFAAAVSYTVGHGPHGITAGDFDGDGNLDLAVINMLDNNISVLLNQ